MIDQNSDKAAAEAEDIRHAGVFLGCPLVTGTSGIPLTFQLIKPGTLVKSHATR